MAEQQKMTEEQFLTAQRIESLCRQNAQQAARIADLEAQILLVNAKQQQETEEKHPVQEEMSDEDYQDIPADALN